MKYYVSENATDEQVKAAQQLIQAVFAEGLPPDVKVLSSEKVPVSVERTETTVKFSVPASTVEIEMVEARDGKPIKIQNLPGAWAVDYTQYKSITNRHFSKDKEFSYSGTNGYTAKWDISSEK